jgi:hypothetical protein
MQQQQTTPGQIMMWFAVIVLIAALSLGVLFGLSAVYRKYSIWSKEQKGRATLAEATWDRQVKVEEAKANLESEKMNAQAEVERAKGAAQSMQIENGQCSALYFGLGGCLYSNRLDPHEDPI